MINRIVRRNGIQIEGLVHTIEIPSFEREVVDDSRHAENTERRELGYLRHDVCIFHTTSLTEFMTFTLEAINKTVSDYIIGLKDSGTILSTFNGRVIDVHTSAPVDGQLSFQITVQPKPDPNILFNFLLVENGEKLTTESGEPLLWK